MSGVPRHGRSGTFLVLYRPRRFFYACGTLKQPSTCVLGSLTGSTYSLNTPRPVAPCGLGGGLFERPEVCLSKATRSRRPWWITSLSRSHWKKAPQAFASSGLAGLRFERSVRRGVSVSRSRRPWWINFLSRSSERKMPCVSRLTSSVFRLRSSVFRLTFPVSLLTSHALRIASAVSRLTSSVFASHLSRFPAHG